VNEAGPAPIAGLSEVWKRYSRNGPWALREVDLAVGAGTVQVILGGNGDGKSTLLRILAGASGPTRGRVHRPRVHRPGGSVAYVPERLPVDLRMTAKHYLAHMARLRGLDAVAARAGSLALLDRLGLKPGPDVPIGTLSKGNSQKVALAQAFLATAALTVLDEPFAGLDRPAARELVDVVRETRDRGGSVVFSAHHAGGVPVDADSVHVLAAVAGVPTRLVLRPPGQPAQPGQPDQPDRTAGLPGVRSFDHDRSTNLVAVVTADPDSTLRAALGSGWSFVRGGPAETGRRP
jgi:ABC-2 type transport system ATP-binding protein